MSVPEIERGRPLTFFAYSGWLAAIVVAITYLNWFRLGAGGWLLTWQFAGVGIATGIVSAALLKPRAGNVTSRWAIAGSILLAIVVVAIAAWDHRRIAVVLALLQTLSISALHRSLDRRVLIWLALSAFVSWTFATGMTHEHFGDLLLNGDPSSALMIVTFVLAFGLTIYELRESEPGAAPARTNYWLAAFAGILFLALAMRTDNLGVEWIPFHRSYFADVSQFVRDGHWLLWDIPSLYGFLSMLTLAWMPAKNGYQAVYELTAIFLTFQACVVFAILRWGRAGVANALFAILFPTATIFADQLGRFPLDARLYPQGGLRFFWVVALLLTIFLMYVWREDRRKVTVLRWIGCASWVVSLFWSIEVTVWITTIWIPYLALDVLATRDRPGILPAIGAFARRYWPLVVIPLIVAGALDLFYRVRLGHAPDWRTYFEFTGTFASGKIKTVIRLQPYGAGWSILLILGAIGALGLTALRERRWDLMRLLAGAWLAAWSTASYYAVEPLDMYAVLLLTASAPAVAIAIFASRELFEDRTTVLIARYAFAPLAIVAIAVAFGTPSRLLAMKLPFTPGWNFDVTQSAPPISGELGDLMRRANVAPSDAVLIPNGQYWDEPERHGMIQPFTRLASGEIVEYRSWLPISPVAPNMLYNALAERRQRLYIDRFLDISQSAGWYVTYREPAQCESLSTHLRTVRTLNSVNFSASLCQYHA